MIGGRLQIPCRQDRTRRAIAHDQRVTVGMGGAQRACRDRNAFAAAAPLAKAALAADDVRIGDRAAAILTTADRHAFARIERNQIEPRRAGNVACDANDAAAVIAARDGEMDAARRAPCLGDALVQLVAAPDVTGPAPARRGGGPDAFGYRWADSNEPGGPAYDWVDISTTGTAVSLGDDATTTVALPFPFSYYGVDQTSVRIVSNGWLGFGGSSTAYSNAAIPSSADPNNALFAFWDDLNPASGGQIKYQDMGDGRFVVSWIGVPRYSETGSALTFQVILASSGAITYQYKTMTGTLNSASIGIENAAGTDGLPVVFNAPYVENNLAIRFASLFVDADVTSGLIPAGQSRDVTLTFDATGLVGGNYHASLTITTNSPNAPSTVIPVSLTVGAVADEAGPLAFEGTHLLGTVTPNPSRGTARVDLAVATAQTVRVELYDALGRRVGVTFDGPLSARTPAAITVGQEGLAAGTYVLRVVGETFQDTRRITVVR